MIHLLPSAVFRVTLRLLVLAALGGCTLFHPFRIPTPKPSPEFIAQQAAAKKAKKAREAEEKANIGTGSKTKGGGLSFLKGKKSAKKKADESTEEGATDVAAPINGAASSPTASAGATGATTAESRTMPERSTVRYDKEQLMKKPKLIRRRVHKPVHSFHPWQSIRHFFKYTLHGKKPNYAPDHRPVVPSPEPAPDAAPDAAPADATPAPEPTPAAVPVPKPAPKAPARPAAKSARNTPRKPAVKPTRKSAVEP